MGLGVGLNSYFGIGEESAWGTQQTPDRFYPIAQESIQLQKSTINPKTMVPGKYAMLGDRRIVTKTWGDGSFDVDVTTTGMGRLFKHALGATSGPTQQAATTAYLSTFTVGTLQGKGLTAQKVIRDSASNVLSTLTLVGSKINTIEFKDSVSQILSCTVGVVGKQLSSVVSAASSSYSANSLFDYMEGAVTLGGSSIGVVKSYDIKLDNKLKTDRDYIGSNGVMAEPVDGADFKALTGTLTIDFTDADVAYAAYAADTDLALVITYTGATIASTYKQTFKITCPHIKLDGDTPQINGPGEVSLSCKFTGYVLTTGSDSLLQLDYMSSDSAF